MRKTTQTGLLSRRIVLAASAAIMLTALPAKAQDAVKVGMSGPFSGGLSLLGQSVRDGVEVAFAEINEQEITRIAAGQKAFLRSEAFALQALRMLVSRSAIGSVTDIISLRAPRGIPGEPGLPARLHHARNLAQQRQLPEADPADAEVPEKRPGADFVAR